MSFEPINPNACRCGGCQNLPAWVGTWQVGEEKGLRIPYCNSHRTYAAERTHGGKLCWTDVTPWPDRTVDEILEEFYKELES